MKRLIKKGTLPFKCASEIPFSRVGVGFEKLDRGLFDPEKAYDLVAGLGVKFARIQSGWMRTEREKGVYDFAWIDSIVDNLLARGVEPWIDLAYGNPLYTPIAKNFFGAVGCPPLEEKALAAWCAYAEALARRMKGKVDKYEIWNEPDLRFAWRLEGKTEGTRGTPDGKEYGEFAKATAAAIRAGDPGACVIGFAVGKPYHFDFLTDAMKTGLGELLDAASYHCYDVSTVNRVRYHDAFAALLRSYKPGLEIIQGESGTQSEYSLAGALKFMDWTPEKQTKHLLRLMITDLSLDCKFVSYFSAMDMVEALHGLNSNKKSYMDYGFFGVIRAEFDENGVATGTYTRKPSYFALQTVATLFAGDAKPEPLPYAFSSEPCSFTAAPDYDGPALMIRPFRLGDGARLFTYWKDCDILTETVAGTVTVTLAADEVPELIDLKDGTLYAIPDEMVTRQSGAVTLTHLPLRDYPLALRWRN